MFIDNLFMFRRSISKDSGRLFSAVASPDLNFLTKQSLNPKSSPEESILSLSKEEVCIEFSFYRLSMFLICLIYFI